VGTVFFSALSLSLSLVLLHGAFREPDNLFIDEGEVRAVCLPALLAAMPDEREGRLVVCNIAHFSHIDASLRLQSQPMLFNLLPSTVPTGIAAV
jgi:hypothetical protein